VNRKLLDVIDAELSSYEERSSKSALEWLAKGKTNDCLTDELVAVAYRTARRVVQSAFERDARDRWGRPACFRRE
jgi:hypothetical protein